MYVCMYARMLYMYAGIYVCYVVYVIRVRYVCDVCGVCIYSMLCMFLYVRIYVCAQCLCACNVRTVCDSFFVYKLCMYACMHVCMVYVYARM